MSGVPSFVPRTASGPCAMTPLWVLMPVTIAVMPAAESVTHSDAVLVSDKPMNGNRCTKSRCGAP